MKKKSEIKVAVDADISDSANEVIKNSLSHPTRSVGDTVGTLIDFFNNTILFPLQKYNIYAVDKLEKYAEELRSKANDIPEEKRATSSINILGPTMDALKYNLDEEHIKNMFINILTSDMNLDKKNYVLPSFVEIVKQLSNDDAKFLNTLYSIYMENKNQGFALVNIVLYKLNDSTSYITLDKYIVTSKNKALRIIKINPLILDNLIRLGIIKLDDAVRFSQTDLYENGFSHIKNNYKDIPKELGTISYQSSILFITDFGLQFLNVCVE